VLTPAAELLSKRGFQIVPCQTCSPCINMRRDFSRRAPDAYVTKRCALLRRRPIAAMRAFEMQCGNLVVDCRKVDGGNCWHDAWSFPGSRTRSPLRTDPLIESPSISNLSTKAFIRSCGRVAKYPVLCFHIAINFEWCAGNRRVVCHWMKMQKHGGRIESLHAQFNH